MMQPTVIFENVLNWCLDPVARHRAALRRAERKGMARKMEPLERALAEADALGVQFYHDELVRYREVLQSVAPVWAAPPAPRQIEPTGALLSAKPVTETPVYVVSPVTLAQAYAHLTPRLPESGEEPEGMLAVTGVQQDGWRTLEHLIDVPLAKQSATTASFDMRQFARIAITLYEKGLALHAIFHSHRFAGQPQPSPVDWRLQDLLDQGGYPAIQAVFSEDGYVRFFARRPFSVTVAGKGVQCVDQAASLYRLVHFDMLPGPGNVPTARPAGAALRPLRAD
jgi:hypothetical protein